MSVTGIYIGTHLSAKSQAELVENAQTAKEQEKRQAMYSEFLEVYGSLSNVVGDKGRDRDAYNLQAAKWKIVVASPDYVASEMLVFSKIAIKVIQGYREGGRYTRPGQTRETAVKSYYAALSDLVISMRRDVGEIESKSSEKLAELLNELNKN